VLATQCSACGCKNCGRHIGLCQRYRALTYHSGEVEYELDPTSPGALLDEAAHGG